MTYISKHFTLEEVTCGCGCGFSRVSAKTLNYADRIRIHEGKPVQCSSGCRCCEHNAAVNGAPLSRHLPSPSGKLRGLTVFQSDGMDLHLDNPSETADWLDENHPDVSYIIYEWGLHMDCRPETYKKRL